MSMNQPSMPTLEVPSSKKSKIAVCVSRKKSKVGPISFSLIQAADDFGIDVKFFDQDLSRYDAILCYINDADEIPPSSDKLVGWWMCDLREPYRWDRDDLDVIFLCNKELEDEYSRHFMGALVEYVPQPGFEHTQINGEEVHDDVLFIGNFDPVWHTQRGELIEALNKEFSVKVVSGEHWTKNQGELYRSAPISLSCSPPADHYTSNRMYNILASKGFCLTNKWPGIRHHFDNHKDLVWYESISDAIEKVRYYLDKPGERRRIAHNGYIQYRKRHTGHHRLKKMIETLCNLM